MDDCVRMTGFNDLFYLSGVRDIHAVNIRAEHFQMPLFALFYNIIAQLAFDTGH
jgi:hypothetical protein